jgi:Bacterial TSP3 repeat
MANARAVTGHRRNSIRHAMKRLPAILASAAALGLAPCLHAGPPMSKLKDTEEATIGGINWKVRYTDDNTSDHYVPPADALDLLGFIDDLYQRQVNDFGFDKHWVSSLPDFDAVLYDVVANGDDDLNGYYDYDRFVLDVADMSSPLSLTDKKVTAHEMFHAIQTRYLADGGSTDGIIETWGRNIAESHARCMDDRWFTEFDLYDGGSTLYLKGSTGVFYNDYTDFDFWKIGTADDNAKGTADDAYPYAAAIYWSYLCEQLGGEMTEPGNGYDWIKRFLKVSKDRLTAGSDLDGKIATDDAIDDFARGSGEDFDSMYFDFAICNYARKFDQSLLPTEVRYRGSTLVPRYEYRDERETGASGSQMNYGSVPVLDSTNATSASWSAQTVMPNSAKYYVWDISASLDSQKCEVMGVRATASTSLNLAILGITRSGKIAEIRKFSGTEAARCFLISNRPAADPVCKIAVVAVGVDAEVSDLDLQFQRGPATLQIVRPLDITRPAYPGPCATPGNFLARLLVTGPAGLTPDYFGNLSVQGLLAEDFEVTVGTASAVVRSAGYVGGEYWLDIEAPVQAADGLQNLVVSMCDGGITDTNTQSVLYGVYTFRHSVCLDLSGSMNYPPEKLDAAKQAAMFYIDTVRDDDRVGLVSFSGNGSEPDTDATAFGGKIYPANWLSRGLLKVAVNGLTAAGLTSIGDGLWTSQDTIDSDTSTAGPVFDTILLLSDGRQNEDRYWQSGSTVYQRFLGGGSYGAGNDTVVNTLSFGAEADTNLMQGIAAATAGDYGHIDVIEPTRTRATEDPRYRMYFDLALGHLAGIERGEGLSRVAYAEAEAKAGATAQAKLAAGSSTIDDGVISVFWYGDAGPLEVNVKDPSGATITTTRAVFLPDAYTRGERHRILRMKVHLTGGDYTVSVINPSAKDCKFFAAISGKPRNEVECRIAFSSFLRDTLGGREDLVRQRFELGQPVSILAFLTDANGPVKGGTVTTSVLLPDGATACGPLVLKDDGRSHDGAADDGVYGAVFRQTCWAQSNGTDIDLGQTPPSREASGIYRVAVQASGKAGDGTTFSRTLKGAFAVYKEQDGQKTLDADGDGLPYSWEISQGTNPTVADASKDPDEDGLTNLGEYQHGTLAHAADTDGGGESDGSEVTKGRCPLQASDDGVSFSNHLFVLAPDEVGHLPTHPDAANTNFLHFSRIRSCDKVELQRALSPAGPWTTIAQFDPRAATSTVRPDPGLVAGTTYSYRMRTIQTSTGATSRWSDVANGTPRTAEEVHRPDARLRINHGNPRTDQLKLHVSITTHPDVVQYRLSHKPLTATDPWQAWTAGKALAYTLPGLTGAGTVQLHAEVRDGDGYVSEAFGDTITFDPSTAANPDNDGDGISDSDEILVHGTDPDRADTDGDGLNDKAELTAGLKPRFADSDGDKLADGAETSAGTNPKSADTDGDGQDDWEEKILLVTDPRNSGSRFDALGATAMANGSLKVRFQSRAGVSYYFEESSDLVNYTRLDTKTTGTGSIVEVTLAPRGTGTPAKRFIRIRPGAY